MHPAARRLAIESAVIAAGLFAGWRFVLGPMNASLASAQAALTEKSSQLEQVESAFQGRIDPQTRLEAVRARAAALAGGQASVRDPGELYDALVSAAARNNVELARIDPRRDARAPSGPDGRAILGVTAYSMSLEGDYRDVVSFVRDLERRFPLTVIGAVRVTSGDDAAQPDRVAVTLETAHYTILDDLSVAAAGGGS